MTGLLARIERMLRIKGIRETRFGRIAVNDPRLVSDLRRGRELRTATLARVERALDVMEVEP